MIVLLPGLSKPKMRFTWPCAFCGEVVRIFQEKGVRECSLSGRVWHGRCWRRYVKDVEVRYERR